MSTCLTDRLELNGKLPTPPGVVVRLLELTRQSDVSTRDIAEAIAMDPVLTAKILRFVNSPMAGVGREVSSLHQAVALLGVRGVKMMALSLAVLGSGKANGCAGFHHDQFVLESLACGAAAKVVAAATRCYAPQDAFAAGLLSQIGRAVLAAGVPAEYAQVLSRAKRVPHDLPPLELEAFGQHYAQVGADLLRRWGLPEAICHAVRLFRESEDAGNASSLAHVLGVAERAAEVICIHDGACRPEAEEFAGEFRRYFAMDEPSALGLLGEIAREMAAIRKALEISKGRVRSVDEIESEVRERIAELSVSMHLENQTMALQQADLLHRATTDALTGVGNRAAFDARMQLELDRAARGGTPFALLMLDVDHFKAFNDRHGHQAGDRVLQAVARILDDNLRKVDYLARYGGEEFAVIAPETPYEGVRLLAERLRTAVSHLTVPWESLALRVTVSVGAVCCESVDANQAAMVIRAADEQLYLAKSRGRNRVEARRDLAPAVF